MPSPSAVLSVSFSGKIVEILTNSASMLICTVSPRQEAARLVFERGL